MIEKTLHNTDVDGATKNVPDIVKFGNGDMFQTPLQGIEQERRLDEIYEGHGSFWRGGSAGDDAAAKP